ncbi:TPA: hypothetical protein DCW54_02280 [Candidatus Dependentiae bacterium]|nr:hypothetical protein [Candidatus Dependentiae bacterium]
MVYLAHMPAKVFDKALSCLKIAKKLTLNCKILLLYVHGELRLRLCYFCMLDSQNFFFMDILLWMQGLK